MAAFREMVMVTVAVAIFAAMLISYLLADFVATHGDCGKPCRSCPHWDRCLSRRVCRVEPSQDPELCILRWS